MPSAQAFDQQFRDFDYIVAQLPQREELHAVQIEPVQQVFAKLSAGDQL